MNRGGFTLMEVLLSVVVMGLAFVVIAQGLTGAARAVSISETATEAVGIASRTMAEVETGARSLQLQSSERVLGGRAEYEVVVTPSATGHAGLVEVTVEVAWRQQGYERRTVLVRYVQEALRGRVLP